MANIADPGQAAHQSTKDQYCMDLYCLLKQILKFQKKKKKNTILKIQMEWQMMQTLIRLLHEEQSDPDPICLFRAICPNI